MTDEIIHQEGRKTAKNTLWAVTDRCRRLAVRLNPLVTVAVALTITAWWSGRGGAAQTNTPQAKTDRLASKRAGWKLPEEGVSLVDLNGLDHLSRAADSDPDDDADISARCCDWWTSSPRVGKCQTKEALWHKHVLKHKIQHVSISKMLISISWNSVFDAHAGWIWSPGISTSIEKCETVGLNKLQILKIHAVSRKIFLSESTSSAVETEKKSTINN